MSLSRFLIPFTLFLSSVSATAHPGHGNEPAGWHHWLTDGAHGWVSITCAIVGLRVASVWRSHKTAKQKRD